MSRVINPESAGKERRQLSRAVVFAIRELMQQTETNENTRDLVAFIVLTLEEISKGIDLTVAPWEKRGYWVKADRFRMDWIWTSQLADSLRNALLNDDWQMIAVTTARIAQKLNNVSLPKRYKFNSALTGAWEKVRVSK